MSEQGKETKETIKLVTGDSSKMIVRDPKRPKSRRGSRRIGPNDPLFQDVVRLSNEFPERMTLSGAAEMLHGEGKWKDVKANNLKNRIKGRLKILMETNYPEDHEDEKKAGKPMVLNKKETKFGRWGEPEGYRLVYYQPGHETQDAVDIKRDPVNSEELVDVIKALEGIDEYVRERLVRIIGMVYEERRLEAWQSEVLKILGPWIRSPGLKRAAVKMYPDDDERIAEGKLLDRIEEGVSVIFDRVKEILEK